MSYLDLCKTIREARERIENDSHSLKVLIMDINILCKKNRQFLLDLIEFVNEKKKQYDDTHDM